MFTKRTVPARSPKNRIYNKLFGHDFDRIGHRAFVESVAGEAGFGEDPVAVGAESFGECFDSSWRVAASKAM